ncbi:hypothetical protein M413DRAFT_442385 [Hebeloma cylindrosporum]|uniref:Uncharacterized protein n=1 Tax=Hebeloma cylindrosporum TaxID=76867 RepID=A0A0C2YTQ3_HEBCY|nr:hypothetical protein M413DRAFT_442385 [Hebeloma cylindrosporum h7]
MSSSQKQEHVAVNGPTSSSSGPLTSQNNRPEPPLRKPIPANYKRLPSGWKASEHHYFYGWAVTEDILRNHLIKHRLRVPKSNLIELLSTAISNIEQQTAYFHICYVGGKVDDKARAQGRVIETDEGPELNLLAISCTRSARLFQRRPSQRQLDRMVQLLGEEPRWFEDSNTKANFVSDFMD